MSEESNTSISMIQLCFLSKETDRSIGTFRDGTPSCTLLFAASVLSSIVLSPLSCQALTLWRSVRRFAVEASLQEELRRRRSLPTSRRHQINYHRFNHVLLMYNSLRLHHHRCRSSLYKFLFGQTSHKSTSTYNSQESPA